MPSKAAVPAVFVRGLAYTLNDEELAAHFSEVAPVKRAFIVRDKTTHESRGYGFVQFAIEEDATLAASTLNGSTLVGRKIQVTTAAAGAAASADAVVADGRKPRARSAPTQQPEGALLLLPPTALPSVVPTSSASAVVIVAQAKKAAKAQSASESVPPPPVTTVTTTTTTAVQSKEKVKAPTPAVVNKASTIASAKASALTAKVTAQTSATLAAVLASASAPPSAGNAAAGNAAATSAPRRPVSAHAAARGRAGAATTGPPALTDLLRNGNLKARSLILLGLGTAADYKKVWVRVRKAAGVEDMTYPVPILGSEGARSAGAAVVRFGTREARDAAVLRFDGRELCGSKVAARAGDSALFGREAHDVSRLIVRNLHFEATADHLRAAIVRCMSGGGEGGGEGKESIVKTAGGGSMAEVQIATEAARVAAARSAVSNTLTDLSLPMRVAEKSATTNDDTTATAATDSSVVAMTHRGFAFLEFFTRADAAATLDALNGKKVHKRVVAVDWALNKNDYAKLASTAVPVETDTIMSSAPASSTSAAAAAVKSVKGNKGNSDDDADENDDESDTADGNVDSDSSDNDDDNDDDDATTAAVSTSAAPSKAPVTTDDARLGTTLFLRNVGFDTRDADLVATCRAFGPVRYARIVIDASTGRSRGTAFVQFFNKGGADAVLDAAFSRDDHFEEADEKRPPRIAASIEAAKISGGFFVKERKLMVARAITKEEAAQLVAAREASNGGSGGPGGKKFDARHLYLAHEGNIREGSDAASAMPAGDLAKRSEAIKAKKDKLKSPLFFVNPTRLLIKGLGRGMDDKALTTRAREAAAKGVETRLVDVREGDPRLMPAVGADEPVLKVLKAKIVRDVVSGANATDAREGRAPRFEADGVTPRSKGFAFVEFSTHFHALAALRELNNNPTYSDAAQGGAAAKTARKPVAEWPRLIVEFAVENIVKVRAHEAKKAGARARSVALNSTGGGGGGDGATETGGAEEGGEDANESGGAAPFKRVRPSRREASGSGKRKADALRAAAKVAGGTGDDVSAETSSATAAKQPAAKRQRTAEPQKTTTPAVLLPKGSTGKATSRAAPRAPPPRNSAAAADAELDNLVADVDGRAPKRGRGGMIETTTSSDKVPARRQAKKKALSAEAARDAMIESYRQSLYA